MSYEALKLIDKSEIQSEAEEKNTYDTLFRGTAYRYKDYCLYRSKKTNDTEELFYLSNFFIIPVAETVKDNGQDQERYFTLKPIFEGKEYEAADIPADKFNSMTFIPQTWGLSLRPAVGQNTLAYIRDSIQALAKHIKLNHIYSCTGWRQINNKWAFLYHGGAVGNHHVNVELEGRLNRYALPDKGDYNEASKIAFKMLQAAPREITIPMMAITFLSVLNEFARQAGIEPSFIIYLLGQSGTMKSTLAALALSYFGAFDNKSLPGSFKDTGNSLEKQGFLLKDVLTCVDDYHPTMNRLESQRMETTAQMITRAYGDRTGRNRMNSDTTLKKSYIPRGNCIITGEDTPNIGQSGTARHLVLELKKGDIDTVLLSELQENADKLAVSMRGYIEWLIPQTSELPKYLKEQFTNLRQSASKEGQHNRLPEVVAHLQTGFIMMLRYFQSINVITQEESEEWAQSSWNVLLGLAEKQSKRIQEDRPVSKFISALKEMLAVSQCYTVKTNNAGVDATQSIGFIGYEDDTYYYLYPEATYKAVVQFFHQQGEHFPLTKNMLLKHLAIEKIIITDGVKNVKQKKIGSKNFFYMWVLKDTIGTQE